MPPCASRYGKIFFIVKVKNEHVVSIIVPAYNAEKYLNKCIDSILSQSHRRIEIILVNDGSSDNTGQLFDEYAKKDSRVKVIHTKNEGLSHARNVGIKEANGDYVCFVDSDDRISALFVEKLLDAAINNGTRISQCDVRLVDENTGKSLAEWKVKPKSNVVDGRKLVLDSLHGDNTQNVVVWNRIYDRSLLSANSFEEKRIHEDEFFTYKILYDEKVALVHECLYQYTQNPSGIMKGGKYSAAYRDAIDAFNAKNEFFAQRGDIELLRADCVYILSSIIPSIIIKYATSDNKKKNNEVIKRLKEEYRQIAHVAKEWNIKIPYKTKAKAILKIRFHAIYVKLKNVKK